MYHVADWEGATGCCGELQSALGELEVTGRKVIRKK